MVLACIRRVPSSILLIVISTECVDCKSSMMEARSIPGKTFCTWLAWKQAQGSCRSSTPDKPVTTRFCPLRNDQEFLQFMTLGYFFDYYTHFFRIGKVPFICIEYSGALFFVWFSYKYLILPKSLSESSFNYLGVLFFKFNVKRKKKCSFCIQLCYCGCTKLIGCTAFTPLKIKVKVT